MNICLYKNMIETGGAEKQLILLANALSRKKFKTYVLVKRIDDNISHLFGDNVEVIKIKPRSIIKQFIWVRRFFRERKIDICHVWDFRSSIVAYISSLFICTKLIDGSIRSALSKKMIQYSFYHIKYSFFKLIKIDIVSNSVAGLKSYCLEKYKRAHVIHNGIDICSKNICDEERNSNKDMQNCAFIVGMVANMRWKKDFLTFIKSGIEVLKKRNDVLFYVVGDGIDMPKYKRYLEGHKNKENFKFVGHTTKVEHYIMKMDVCVLANSKSGEGISNSIMEYMICGKPVIATDLGGNNELVINGVTGFLVEEYDYKDIAGKIIYLLENPIKRLTIGIEGRKIIETKFSVDAMVDKYTDVYKNSAVR